MSGYLEWKQPSTKLNVHQWWLFKKSALLHIPFSKWICMTFIRNKLIILIRMFFSKRNPTYEWNWGGPQRGMKNAPEQPFCVWELKPSKWSGERLNKLEGAATTEYCIARAKEQTTTSHGHTDECQGDIMLRKLTEHKNVHLFYLGIVFRWSSRLSIDWKRGREPGTGTGWGGSLSCPHPEPLTALHLH